MSLVLPEQLRWHASAFCPHDILPSHASNLSFCNFQALNGPLRCWTLESSSCLVITMLLSGSFLTMFTRVLYIIVFPSHVTLIHLQCVPFILYQDMDSFVLGIKPLIQMSLQNYWVFSCRAPCQASFRHLPLSLKLRRCFFECFHHMHSGLHTVPA